jgi:hypothetical protein
MSDSHDKTRMTVLITSLILCIISIFLAIYVDSVLGNMFFVAVFIVGVYEIDQYVRKRIATQHTTPKYIETKK